MTIGNTMSYDGNFLKDDCFPDVNNILGNLNNVESTAAAAQQLHCM
jgi:hypothetical protein